MMKISIFFCILFIFMEECNGIEIDEISGSEVKVNFGDRTLIIVISLSFKIFNAEAVRWSWNYGFRIKQALKRICDHIQNFNTQTRRDCFIVIFPQELRGQMWNGSTKGMDLQSALEYCQSKLKFEKYMEQDIGRNEYEPVSDFNTKLLENISNQPSSSGNERIILFFTNFAEKALTTRLNQNPSSKVYLLAMNMFTLNYYYYTLRRADTVNFWLFYATYYCYRYDLKGDCIFYEPNIMAKTKFPWPIIYMFALSSNSTQNQMKELITAVKKPVFDYCADLPAFNQRPISILPMWFSTRMMISMNKFYDKPSKIFQVFNSLYSYTSENNLINAAEINSTSKHILKMYERSMEIFHYQFMGAQLPFGIAADAVIKPAHPQPRIVLITDFVEDTFVNSIRYKKENLELKIYALSTEVFKAYQGKADVVVAMDQDSPGFIPVNRNDTEPSISNTTITPAEVYVPKSYMPSWYVWTAIFVGLAALMIIVLLFRRMRNFIWLHKLEQFKTEHIFAAYMNMQDSKIASSSEDLESAKDGQMPQDPWEISWDQLQMSSEKLGEGVFGEVHKATLTNLHGCSSNGFSMLKKMGKTRLVAVKTLPEYASTMARQNFLNEIEIMKSLGNGHRCVVTMLGCVTGPSEIKLGLVLEFCPGGNLLGHLRRLKEMEEAEKLEKLCGWQFSRWAWQIADGMRFLASKNLVHRDLAARNVLLDEEMVAKISDFGLCIRLNTVKFEATEVKEENLPTIANEKLPIRWLAPESLEKRQFSEKSDVWSFGILLHEMYTFGTNPFEGIDPKALLEHIQHFQLPKMEMCPEKMFECMQACLNSEESLRPDFAQIQIKLAALLEEKAGEYGYLMLN